MVWQWFLSQLHWLRPGFWLLLSLAAAFVLLAAGPRLSPERRRLFSIARWIAVPYLGLVVGGLSPRLMGLTNIDWVAGLGLGLGLIFAILVLVLLVRTTLDLEDPRPALEEAPPGTAWLAGTIAGFFAAGALEFHWAFLRGSLWEILLSLPTPPDLPHYWAIWAAVGIGVVESFSQSGTKPQRLVGNALLITTAILFLYTRNFWLCWLLHAAVRLVLLPGRPVTTTGQAEIL